MIVLKNSEISCTGLAIFAILMLLLMIFPSIWVVSPESSEYLMYSIVAVDPAVSCKRNRFSLMNFPNIRGFPQEGTLKYMRIYLIVPNIWNPRRDTAEIIELLELGTRLLLNPLWVLTIYFNYQMFENVCGRCISCM